MRPRKTPMEWERMSERGRERERERGGGRGEGEGEGGGGRKSIRLAPDHLEA